MLINLCSTLGIVIWYFSFVFFSVDFVDIDIHLLSEKSTFLFYQLIFEKSVESCRTGEKIVINGKAFTSYSELKSEYPDFNMYVEEEMNKVLDDIETSNKEKPKEM